MDVQWFINPGNNQPVSIYFDYLETETDQDLLTIYDGPDTNAAVLARYSGVVDLSGVTITASSDEMFVTFVSDGQVTAKGFLARYCTVAPEGEYGIIGEEYPCESSTDAYFAMGQEGANFTWSSDQGWNFVEKTANGIDLDIGSSQGILSVTPVNRCGTGSVASLAIKPKDATPELEFVLGDTVPCVGQSTRLHTNSISGTTYQWDLPLNWAGNSESDTLFYKPASKGTVRVRGINACGEGNELSLYIDAWDVPAKPNILSDPIPPCANTLQEFYVLGTPGTEYVWETQNDWIIQGDSEGDTVRIAVGESQSFLFVNSRNKCGSNRTNRLFLTAPLPAEPQMIRSGESNGYPELRVTNSAEFESIQWYRNEVMVPGLNGTSNPLVVNLNGFYTVESVSDKGCRTLIDPDFGIDISLDQLEFLAYRVNKSNVAIVNSTAGIRDFQLIDLSGKVRLAGRLDPGYNEVFYPYVGVFLLRVNWEGKVGNSKVLF
jgi:hypothetical protein